MNSIISIIFLLVKFFLLIELFYFIVFLQYKKYYRLFLLIKNIKNLQYISSSYYHHFILEKDNDLWLLYFVDKNGCFRFGLHSENINKGIGADTIKYFYCITPMVYPIIQNILIKYVLYKISNKLKNINTIKAHIFDFADDPEIMNKADIIAQKKKREKIANYFS